MNTRVIAPITTVMSKISGTHYYSAVDISIKDVNNLAFMKTYIDSELKRYTNSTSDDDKPYTMSSMSEMLSSIESVTATLTLFL